ncbi:MAG: Stk1 family PASTA domain-containing Ser/Thr kinase [Thermoleophilia bacterium]
MFDNRYEIIRRLGSGGMADVYLAKDTHLGREVAIKILYKRYARDEEFVARFRREAQSAAALNHPHIVSIFDRGEADGSYYIAMEYLEGKSLKEVIPENGLEPVRAIEISMQILQALQFAHENNVIHRDIKPHNIVINGRGQVKVTDFGIARAGTAPAMTETGSIIGTAQYLSPEQAKGKAVEQSSDLYSMGVVLYEMLTGKVPFEGENPVAIALKHLSDMPVPPQALAPRIPDNLNAVVMRALAKDPRDRYPTAEEFIADLERCRQNLPVTAAATSADNAMTSVIPAGVAAAAGAALGAGTDTARPETLDPTMVRQTQPGSGGKKGIGNKKYLYMLLAFVALAAAATGIYLLAFAQQGSIPVPSVTGLDRVQAEANIKAVGLKSEIESEEFSDSVAVGKVIRQNPEAGAKLKQDGVVRLVISKGSNKVAVPDFLGQSSNYAESKLKEAGLTGDRQPDAYSASVAEGNVVSQDPAPGTQVQKGSAVKYVVSKGPEPPKEVTVPDVTTMTTSQAETSLAAAGLKLGDVTKQNHASMPNGQIISQNPAAGSKAKEGSSVSVVISKGPAPVPVTVPELYNMTQVQAQAALDAKGLIGSFQKVSNPDAATHGFVYDQNPAVGTIVDAGSTVTAYIGKP